MAWMAYIDSMCKQGSPMCGIYMKDTGVVCAQTDNMKATTPAEIISIRSCIEGKDQPLVINASPCVMTTKDEGFVHGKTKACCHDGEKMFFHCEVTGKYLVIAGKHGAGERQATGIGANIAKHLRDSGN